MANTMLTQYIVCSPLPIFLIFMEDDMKHLTRIAAALLAGAMAFTFASCDDDDDDDGVTELSEWELCYTDTSGYYWEWDIEFNSDDTFEIELDVEYGRNDVFDSVFASGTYSGNATTTSGEITLNITRYLTSYSDVVSSGTVPTSTAMTTGTLSGAATIDSGTLTLKIGGVTVGSYISQTSFAKTDGVARSEISEWEYKPSVSGYTVEYTLEFFSDDTFYIELDVETTSGSDVLDDIIFAYGTITSGSASSTSGGAVESLTLAVTQIASDYSSIVGGTYSNVTTTLTQPSDTITLSASITAGATTSADTLTLSSDTLSISSWSFSRDF